MVRQTYWKEKKGVPIWKQKNDDDRIGGSRVVNGKIEKIYGASEEVRDKQWKEFKEGKLNTKDIDQRTAREIN